MSSLLHIALTSSCVLGLAFASGANAQDSSAARTPDQRPTTTVEELADSVVELRVFLTSEKNVVIGEIATEGPTELTEVPIYLEDGPLTFKDDGLAPDKAKSDGIFSARFKMMDVAAQFVRLAPSLKQSAEILLDRDEELLIRRGPRDIVTAGDAMKEFGAQSPEALKNAKANASLVSKIIEFEDPLEAARLNGIDISEIPFIALPGPRFEIEDFLRFPRIFDMIAFDLLYPPVGLPVPVDREKSLMITNTGVVDDISRTFDSCPVGGTAANPVGIAGGAWSFGHLMREMAHGTGLTPEEFVRHWLSSWETDQEANGWLVHDPTRQAQIGQRVIRTWQELSGANLNVDMFPARLLAIVNRPDLADKIGYGAAGSAGEGRLVFGLTEKVAGSGECNHLAFTVIFEYGIKGGSCSAVKAWQQKWKDLDQQLPGTAGYNQALEAITRAFTDHGSNQSQIPNLSSLSQLRTNENALFPPGTPPASPLAQTWQMREFRLQGPGSSVPAGLLDLVTVKQTPQNIFNNSATLDAYLDSKEGDILADKHIVPDRFPTMLDPFLGAVSNMTIDMFWNAPNPGHPPNTAETRRKFSLATCSGCHARETQTNFTHIGVVGLRVPGTPAFLSGFLRGTNVPDPVTGVMHHYEDLAERQNAMSNILSNSCFPLVAFERSPFVH